MDKTIQRNHASVGRQKLFTGLLLRTENTRNKSWGLLKQKIKKLAKDNFITCRVIHIKGETIFLNPKNKKYVLQTEV